MARGIVKKITDEQREQIVELHSKEIPMKYIGKLLGITTHFVKRTLQEEGIYVKSAQGRKATN